MRINQNELAKVVCKEVRAQVGKKRVDVSIAQVKLILRSFLGKLAGEDWEAVAALVRRYRK